MAVAGGGLVTPAIVNATELDLPELMSRLHTGARFLDQIDQLLRQPEKLWEANQS